MVHINKVKVLINLLAIINKLLEVINVIMILFTNLQKSYNYLFIALKFIKIIELIMDYMITRLNYKVT